jgi:hypothetical protein
MDAEIIELLRIDEFPPIVANMPPKARGIEVRIIMYDPLFNNSINVSIGSLPSFIGSHS